MKKIAFVTQDLFGRGAEYATAMIIRGFVAKGYAVDLLLSRVHADYLAEGRKPFDVPTSVRVTILTDRKARNNVGELRRYLKTTDAEVVVAVNIGYTEALAIAALGLRKRPKMFAMEHSIEFGLNPDWSEKPRIKSLSVAGFRNALVKRTYAGYLAVSEGVAREKARVMGLKPEVVHVVFNPVDFSLLDAVSAAKPSHPWLCEKTCPTVITAGSLTPEKNHKILLEAMRIAVRSTKLRLVVFGEGVLKGEYETFVRENGLEGAIAFPGFTHQLLAEMKASDGYVCPSLIESFAIAPVQAMACGVPVVSFDCPCGPREVLAGGKYGRLVPPMEAEGLAEALVALARCEIVVAPRDAWELYSIPRIVERYEKAMGL